MQSPAIASAHNNVSQKNIKSPFTKHSLIWETLEIMEIFQKMPQQPHLCSFDKSKEDKADGLAIGYMVTFANVAESMSRLQVTDPTSLTDSISETLSDLELHGSDGLIRSRLNELLLKKGRHHQLELEFQRLDKAITELDPEKTEINETIQEID
ncbi:DUF724 domain-containing protein 5-like [Actinidia eriantha]|uniref:DUF724 domain-containing protein 5-like n=1 Tax=Actinidia eriantha TaxID=165200 RepID=UPI002587B708|nr:DUF724 domain-containing protein 5-like [Actinidia eriantha]